MFFLTSILVRFFAILFSIERFIVYFEFSFPDETNTKFSQQSHVIFGALDFEHSGKVSCQGKNLVVHVKSKFRELDLLNGY